MYPNFMNTKTYVQTSPLQPHMHSKKKTRNMAYTQQAMFINHTINTSVKRDKDKVKLHSSSIKKTREESKVGFPYLMVSLLHVFSFPQPPLSLSMILPFL